MIIVDNQEPESVSFHLKTKQTKAALPVGDFMFFSHDAKRIVIERKTFTDLLNSFKDGRFQSQVKRIVEQADFPFLLIEGHSYCTRDGFVRIEGNTTGWYYTAMMNFLVTAQLVGVYILLSSNVECSARIIDGLFAYFQKKDHQSSLRLHPVQLFPESDAAKREAVLTSIPGIGPEIAKRLLERFQAPIAVFLADDSELLEVEGMGEARVKALRDVIYLKDNEEEKGNIAKWNREET